MVSQSKANTFKKQQQCTQYVHYKIRNWLHIRNTCIICTPIFSGVPVARSLVFFGMFCRSLFVLFLLALCCLSFFQPCVFCPSFSLVLYVLLLALRCLSFFQACVVCPSFSPVLYVLLLALCCLSFFQACVVCPSFSLVLYVLL